MTSSPLSSDWEMGFGERSLSAAGAAVISAIIVNPLDVAKTRLQAQAAGVPYHPSNDFLRRQITPNGARMIFSDLKCYPSCNRGDAFASEPFCPPDCFRYKGTLDVLYKVVKQEGFSRLWRGTNASLVLAVPTATTNVSSMEMLWLSTTIDLGIIGFVMVVGIYLPCYDIFRNWIEEYTTQHSPNLTPYAPLVAGSLARSLACISCSPIELAKTRMQAFKEFRAGAKPPGMLKTLLGVLSPFRSMKHLDNLQGYRILWTGVGAQLARDVPFSAICWSTLEPIRRRLLKMVGEEGNAASVLAANFSAGFVAGTLAATATCPLDVAKTRRQIEKDPQRVLGMTTRQTLVEVWREGGLKGLFMGVGPRVGRAGPSVGIVVSFYEVVKYVLHERRKSS